MPDVKGARTKIGMVMKTTAAMHKTATAQNVRRFHTVSALPPTLKLWCDASVSERRYHQQLVGEYPKMKNTPPMPISTNPRGLGIPCIAEVITIPRAIMIMPMYIFFLLSSMMRNLLFPTFALRDVP